MSEIEVLAEFDGEVVDRGTTCWYLLLSQTASSNLLKQVITWNTQLRMKSHYLAHFAVKGGKGVPPPQIRHFFWAKNESAKRVENRPISSWRAPFKGVPLPNV